MTLLLIWFISSCPLSSFCCSVQKIGQFVNNNNNNKVCKVSILLSHLFMENVCCCALYFWTNSIKISVSSNQGTNLNADAPNLDVSSTFLLWYSGKISYSLKFICTICCCPSETADDWWIHRQSEKVMPCYWLVCTSTWKEKIQRSEGVKKVMWRENFVHMLSAHVLVSLVKTLDQ